MASGKQFRVKFFKPTGEYITEMPVQFKGFRKIINAGLGDLTLGLPLSFEQAYQNAALINFNFVEFYVDNLLFYSGFLAGIIPTISKGASTVQILCRGHASRWSSLPLKNSTTTTLYTDTTNGLKTTASASAASLDKILKAIVDRHRAEATFPVINYATGSVATSAVTWTYTLVTKSTQYAVDKTMENAPYDWYWRVGADNIFRFLQRSANPDVTLNFKTQIDYLTDPLLMDGMVNSRYFAYNGAPPANAKVTNDSTSMGQYGDWWDFKTDGRYTDVTQVTAANQAVLNAKKNPIRQTVLIVPDNNYSRTSGYQVELLEPGQTLKITNLPDATAAVLPSLFTIVAVEYDQDMNHAKLELGTLTDDLAREVALMEQQNDAESTDSSPATYS